MTQRITFRLGFETTRYDLRSGIATVLDRAPDYHDGQIETIRARQAKLEEIVLAMAELLPPKLQAELAINALGATYVQSDSTRTEAPAHAR